MYCCVSLVFQHGRSWCVDMCLEESWNVTLRHLLISPYRLFQHGGSWCTDLCLEECWNVSLRHLHITPYRLCFSMGGPWCTDLCLKESWNVSLRHLHITPYCLCFSMGGDGGHGALICALKNPGMYHSVIYISVRIACVSAWGVMVH